MEVVIIITNNPTVHSGIGWLISKIIATNPVRKQETSSNVCSILQHFF